MFKNATGISIMLNDFFLSVAMTDNKNQQDILLVCSTKTNNWQIIKHCEFTLANLAWDQGPNCGKKEKKIGVRGKKLGERSELSGSLGRGKGGRLFPLPRPPLGSLRSPYGMYIFPISPSFLPFPHWGAWSQAVVSCTLEKNNFIYYKKCLVFSLM